MVRGVFCKLAVLVVLVVALVCVSCSVALGDEPWWNVQTGSRPSLLTPGGRGQILIEVSDLGDEAVSGHDVPVTISDALPKELKAIGIARAHAGHGGKMSCTSVFPASSVSCSWSSVEALEPYETFEIFVEVEAGPKLSDSELNEVKVSGGEGYECESVNIEGKFSGTYGPFCTSKEHEEVGEEEAAGVYESKLSGVRVAPASLKRVVRAGSSTPFGVEAYDLVAEREGGSEVTQAGSHPFQFTTTVAFNQSAVPGEPPGLPKDVLINWPSGLIGNPTPFHECTEAQFSTVLSGDYNLCPADSVVGVAKVSVSLEGGKTTSQTETVPVFNLVPAPGEPARLGFEVTEVPVVIDTSVRTGGDYGIDVDVHNITQSAALLSSTVTVWGVPGDPRHDNARGWSCIDGGIFYQEVEEGNSSTHSAKGLPVCTSSDESSPPPFLTLPSSCNEPLESSVRVDSWSDPVPSEAVSFSTGTLTGCNKLPFNASISVAPDVQEASKPTGLAVNVHVPQEVSLDGSALAASDVRDMTVTLPEGVAINPAGADGLEACSDGEIGYLGKEPGESSRSLFTSVVGEPFCPDASKIGTARITVPLLKGPLVGSVYLASQDQNPFGSLVAMYIVAEEPTSGVLLKIPGEVSLNPVTGQITATFLDTPQAPFEDAEVHFFGGERAPLTTPSHCGSYTTTASLTPWSGNEPVQAASTFQITSGPNGTPCPGSSLPFNPSLTAGTTSIQAGGFSPFTMTMSREDGEQSLRGISLKMPPGLSGLLTGVKLCGETEANAGTCGPESEIGETTVSVGLGGDPFSVKGGKVFVTGPYEGAPFGLSIVNPAKAGPYNLGQVVVRAKIEVNPITAQLTVSTDDEGPYKIPTILDGIPLEIKHVNVTINRPGFTFNPTSCDPMQITGSITSTEGATANVVVPLQVTNCATLAFKPGFAVSTSGKTSRAKGASLHVKLTYPKAPFGSQANISKVKVDLPKQLPSRLTTLQKACTAATFNADPASCPATSKVGSAIATTPLVPVPLQGPAYFVSYGGAKFPELVIVLQGYGVTVDLHGETFINATTNITSSTFRTVPDVPVGTFELTLPQGPYSALAAIGNLCKSALKMPTAFVAQNGMEIHESTPIGVTGCPKHKTKARAESKGQKGKSGKTTSRGGRRGKV